ncbi:MAG: sulfatase-like hydrolase/transferase [Planctomycetota bacterium]
MRANPHVLKICADQLSPHVLGYAGDPHARTPNLDALAAAGTRFDNHYAACPICIPGRLSMLTGRMPTDLGTPHFEDTLPAGTHTYPLHFAQRGYQTTCVGKMHFHGQEQMHGWMYRPFGDMQMLGHQHLDSYEVARDVTGGNPHRPIRYEAAGGYNAWMLQNAGPGDTGNIRLDRSVTRESIENLIDYFTPSFIDEVYQGDRPLLFETSYKTPHCPFVCPPDLFEYYMDVLPPPTHSDLPDDLPTFLQNKAANDVPDHITPEHIRRARAAYWGLVEWLDGQVGQVLACLDELGLRDQFIIQFTADHGEMAGEHGLWQKHIFYEQSVRIPMILQGPGIPENHVVRSNTSHLDLFPTLCDLAGLDGPDLGEVGDEPWSGRSLVPLLSDDGDAQRLVLSEFRAPAGNGRAEGLPEGVWIVMAKQGPLKLIDYGNGERRGFDLTQEPDERHATTINDRFASLEAAITRYREQPRRNDATSSDSNSVQ